MVKKYLQPKLTGNYNQLLQYNQDISGFNKWQAVDVDTDQGSFFPEIRVDSLEDCTVKAIPNISSVIELINGDSTQTNNTVIPYKIEGNYYYLRIPNFGTWEVSVEKDNCIDSEIVDVNRIKQYRVSLYDLVPVEEIWRTITNVAVATFNAVVAPVRELVAGINAIQSGSGEPSENNIRPFVGFDAMQIIRQRKNLVHNLRPSGRFTASAFYADINADGSFTLTHRENSSTSTVVLTLNPLANYTSGDTAALYALPDLFVLKAGVTYIIQDCTLSCFTGDVSTRVTVQTSTVPKDAHRRHTLTPTKDCHVKQVRTYVSPSTEYDGTFTYYPMVTTAEDLSWEAWQDGITYTVSFSAAGTVYGGTLNVTTGLLTVTHYFGFVTGTERWVLGTGSGYRRFYTLITKSSSYPDLDWESYKDDTDAFSSHFAMSRDNYSNWGAFYISNNNYIVFFDNGSKFENAAALKAWLADQYANGTPVQFVYEMETPQTYQLTAPQIATVLGYNQFIADTGDINTITYREK